MCGNALQRCATGDAATLPTLLNNAQPFLGKITPATMLDGDALDSHRPGNACTGHSPDYAGAQPMLTTPDRLDFSGRGTQARITTRHGSAGITSAVTFERKSSSSAARTALAKSPGTCSAIDTAQNNNTSHGRAGDVTTADVGNADTTCMASREDWQQYATSLTSSIGSHNNSGAASPPATATPPTAFQEETKNIAVRSDKALQLCQLLPMLQRASGARLSILPSNQGSFSHKNQSSCKSGSKPESASDENGGLELHMSGTQMELQAAETLITSLLQP